MQRRPLPIDTICIARDRKLRRLEQLHPCSLERQRHRVRSLPSMRLSRLVVQSHNGVTPWSPGIDSEPPGWRAGSTQGPRISISAHRIRSTVFKTCSARTQANVKCFYYLKRLCCPLSNKFVFLHHLFPVLLDLDSFQVSSLSFFLARIFRLLSLLCILSAPHRRSGRYLP